MKESNSRYPYTYACDLIRSKGGYGDKGTNLSRSNASQIRQVIAKALSMDDEELAKKLADYFLANRKEVGTQALIGLNLALGNKEMADYFIKEKENETFERWKNYIGVENCDHDPITEEGLREWSYNPHKEFQCVFCCDTFTIQQLIKEIACPNCKEYKGIIPYIEGE